jgi:hypothetical protein
MKFITVDQELLDLLLLNAIRDKGLSKPDFKVDKMMGEGTPSPIELEYRQKLLDSLLRFQKATSKVLKDDSNWDEKIKKIDILTQDYISTTQQLPVEYIPKRLEQGIDNAKAELEKNDIKPPRTDLMDNPYLPVMVAQQQEKIESIGWQVRDRLREKIRIMQLGELYA